MNRRKFLHAATGLLAAPAIIRPDAAWAQLSGGLPFPGPGVKAYSAGGDSAAYTNFIARTSGLDSTHLSAYQGLLNGLTTDGFFDGAGASSIFDALYIFATQDSTTALLSLVSATFNAAVNGGGPTPPSFTADRGYTGVAGGGYIDTAFNPSTASSPKYVQNDAHLSAWCNTNTTDNGPIIGNSATGTDRTELYPKYSDNNLYSRVNDGGSGSSGYAMTDPRGLLVGQRTTSTAIEAFQNGSSLGTGSQASTTVVSANMKLFSVPGDGTNLMQCPAASFGKSMTGTQITNYYNRMRTYMTAVGVP